MRATMSLIDLVNALEATSSRLRWGVDLVTGDFLPWNDDGGARGAQAGDAARVRALPRAADLPEGEIRAEFCSLVRDPDVRAQLVAATDAGVPRPTFESLVRAAGLLDEWIAHRRARLVPVALAWAAAQDVRCRGDSRSPSFAVG